VAPNALHPLLFPYSATSERQGRLQLLSRAWMVAYSSLCQNFASETIGGCLRTASCTVGRSFVRNLQT
jgi:hypothetical protein